MHLQQTKQGSLRSGGPQYYLHGATDQVIAFLENKKSVHVALVTPYGATKTEYIALHRNYKIQNDKVVPAGVGHHRIQMGKALESIGEAIRNWHLLPKGNFERIDIEIEIRDQAFYLTPTGYRFDSGEAHDVTIIRKPLTFTNDYKSPLWLRQMEAVEKRTPGVARWALNEICRIVRDHIPPIPHIQESDILRAAGALKLLGMEVGAYCGSGYDCQSKFQFLDYPEYAIPVEVKKKSRGFRYQESKYPEKELSRVVVLCASHNYPGLPQHIDVIELEALCSHSGRLPLFADISGR